MILKKLKNENGIALIMVMSTVIVLGVVAVGVLGFYANQTSLNAKTVEQIRAEQVGKGAYWTEYSARLNGINPQQEKTSTTDLKEEKMINSAYKTIKTKFLTKLKAPTQTGPENTSLIDVSTNSP